MDKKEKIFDKINIRDYTNKLEKILEKKKFSLDTKNLLLSMLYKIENGYADYEKAKVEVPSKNNFIENIFQIIEDDCQEIIVAEFNSEASNLLKEQNKKYIIEKQKGRIVAFANELLVLNCIIGMQEENICFPQEKMMLQEPISDLLNLGNHINQVEVIRDFNGWSWDIAVKEVLDLNANIIFQSLLYIIGDEFVKEWINNKSELADYLSLLEIYIRDNFGEERANKFIVLFCKLAVDICVSKKEEQHTIWKNKKEDLEKELSKLQDKTKFIEGKTKEKRKYAKQIENIDKILNNKDLLKEEYTKRNSKLPNKDKIFSISHLVGRLEKEREDLLEKIKQCNELIAPKGYVARKQDVETKVAFLERLDLEQEQNIKDTVIELCLTFLECFQIKIAKSHEKQEIIDYIYELRYYGFLPINEDGTTLKEVAKLQPAFETNKKSLIEKAKKLNVIDEITEDEKINEEIIANIFDSKMIDLNNMVIITRVTNGKLYVEYYDEKVLETTVQVESNRTVRLRKRTKLFI